MGTMILRGNAQNSSVFSEMERDCFVAGTSVSLANGLSVKIENMGKREHEVLGWDDKCDGMVTAKQINFLHKGKRECIELTYEDGRTQICTEKHRLLTSKNKWIHAEDLVVGKDRLKTCVDNPTIDIDEEIKECNGWKLNAGSIKLSTDTYEGYMKTLAFSRISGVFFHNKSNKVIFETEMDARMFAKDYEMVFSEKLLAKGTLINVQNKIDNFMTLDDIINNPKPIRREFLAAYYGRQNINSVNDLEFVDKMNLVDKKSFVKEIGIRYNHNKYLMLTAENSFAGCVSKGRTSNPNEMQKYYDEIGIMENIDNNDGKSLPTMNLKLVSKKSVGMRDVYDIQVNKVESFLANGIVAHNCMIAHGIGQFLKERMMETSDLYSTYVCDICGFIAQQMLGSPGVYHCPQCENSTDISKINLTYAFKLLVQELMSMNIAPRIRVKKDVYNDLV